MASKISINRKWIQKAVTWQEHFDVCSAKKKKAIHPGAQQITMMELDGKIAKRPGSPFTPPPDPSTHIIGLNFNLLCGVQSGNLLSNDSEALSFDAFYYAYAQR